MCRKLLMLCFLSIFTGCNLFLAEEDTFTLLFTADIRGKLKSAWSPEEYLGDLSILKTIAVREKAFSEHALLVDAGDFSGEAMGDPFMHFLKTRLIIELFRKIGYDAITPGEMDFHYGVDFLKGETEKSGVTVLLANLLDRNMQNVFSPFIIKKFETKRVLITGLLHPGIQLKDYILEDPFIALQRILDTAARENVTFVIVLSHLGFSNDQMFFSMLKGIDVVISAHSEEYLTTPAVSGEALIFKSTIRGQHLAKVQLKFSGRKPYKFVKGGAANTPNIFYDLIPVKPTIAPPNKSIEKFIDGYFRRYANLSELASSCLPCHAEKITRWTDHPHSKKEMGCTFCHEIPEKHSENPSPFLDRNYARGKCTSCHDVTHEKMMELLKKSGCAR